MELFKFFFLKLFVQKLIIPVHSWSDCTCGLPRFLLRKDENSFQIPILYITVITTFERRSSECKYSCSIFGRHTPKVKPSLKVFFFSLDVLETKFNQIRSVVILRSVYIQNKPPTVKYVCALCVMRV